MSADETDQLVYIASLKGKEMESAFEFGNVDGKSGCNISVNFVDDKRGSSGVGAVRLKIDEFGQTAANV